MPGVPGFAEQALLLHQGPERHRRPRPEVPAVPPGRVDPGEERGLARAALGGAVHVQGGVQGEGVAPGALGVGGGQRGGSPTH